jgi:hypothetical protein
VLVPAFGFSVGDFVAVIGLIAKVYRALDEASLDYKELDEAKDEL